MPKLFISYSRVDNQNGFVEQFVKTIESAVSNVSVWWDADLLGGDEWWKEILGAINDCDIFVYLLSNESVNSPYCRAEYTEAQRLNKLILTVQVRGRTEIPPELSEIQYVDLTAGIEHGPAITKLIAAINKLTTKIPKRKLKPNSPLHTPRPTLTSKTEEVSIVREPINAPTAPLAPVQQDQVTRFLSSPTWAGIGVIVTIVLFGLGILWTQNNSNQVTPTTQSTQIVVAASSTSLPETFTETSLPPTIVIPSQTEKSTITLTFAPESGEMSEVSMSVVSPSNTPLLSVTNIFSVPPTDTGTPSISATQNAIFNQMTTSVNEQAANLVGKNVTNTPPTITGTYTSVLITVSKATLIVKSYPCIGTIILKGSDASTINGQVFSQPRGNSTVLSITLTVNQNVLIRQMKESSGEIWYQIANVNNSLLGWVTAQHLLLSQQCLS